MSRAKELSEKIDDMTEVSAKKAAAIGTVGAGAAYGGAKLIKKGHDKVKDFVATGGGVGGMAGKTADHLVKKKQQLDQVMGR